RREGNGDSFAHVSQHAAWQASVVSARLSRYDQRAYHLEIVSGRGAAARVRSEPVRQLAVLLGLFGRQCLREHVPSAFLLVQGNEMIGSTRTSPNAHMQNFLDCIRSGKETNCPFDVGFRVSIACRMSVDSYRQGRAMHWDAASEEIV